MGWNKYESIFQSTLPARGATQISALTGIVQKDFNPRSPHGERHYCNGYG